MMASATPTTTPSSSGGLRKDDRYVTIADAVAVVETFAEQTQQRRVRIQQRPVTPATATAPGGLNAPLPGDLATSEGDLDESIEDASTLGTGSISSASNSSSSSSNMVVVECENAPECKWFVRLSYIKSEKKWKISSMNTTHHKTKCPEASRQPNVGVMQADNGAFQRMMHDDLSAVHGLHSVDVSGEPVHHGAAGAGLTPMNSMVAGNSGASRTDGATASGNAMSSHVFVGSVFMSWKDAIGAIRAMAHQMGRRAVAEKVTQMIFQGKSITVRRIVCQNHRNSNCEWMVVLEESQTTSDQYTVLSMHLLHSKECLETCNFNARKKEQASRAAKSASTMMADGSGMHEHVGEGGLGHPSSTLLVDDVSKYQLTHEMRWSTGKEATKAISDFSLVVQRKRSKLCKKNNGGSNKKYVCSDETCLWFVQLVKGWKSKNWKISAMNLKHSDNCTGQPKPTARQLAEMRFFRQAVITHSKSTGKLLTDNFLQNSESGIKIPRGMAYRAQRLVVATSTDDLTESYKFIPSLLDSFAKKNPGSTVSYEKDEQGHFVRAFLMPNATPMALLCMQQVLGIKVVTYDSVSYNGCMTLLIGRDGDLKHQVLAFALMPNSDMDHMKWFLNMAKTGGVRFDGYPVFCSHNQNGLLRALAHEARSAKIMFCVRSLIEEINRDKNIPKLGALEDLIWEMQAQDTEEGFVKLLNQLESLNPSAAAFIRAVHPKNWASYLNRAVRLYKWSSTGSEEAIMGSEVQFSDEAPFDLIYSFLAFLMDVIFKKSQLVNKLLAENPLLTPGADLLYRRELHESEMYTVRLCDEQVAFTWRTGARPKITHRVDLSLRTCTCGEMYQLGIPCRHFIAVSLHFASETALMDGFDTIYKAAAYAEVNRNLRIEIPAAEDLHKDSSILPAVSLKGTKYKKRARPQSEKTTPTNAAAAHAAASAVNNGMNNGMNHGMNNGMTMGGGGNNAPLKAPRLDFDTDVVTSLTELV